MNIDPTALGPGATEVAALLARGGHGVWFVGGAVRNLLMGRAVSDVDLATDALPDQVIALARAARLKTVPLGLAHGTVVVLARGRPYEVTTLRRDVATDGRHATVTFGGTIDTDAARRDFTMNGLYATPDGTVLDPVAGMPDLKAGIVRFIGDPEARIREDYLRILRFFRFHAHYADPAEGIEAEGLAACAAEADGLERLSRERVGSEMIKLLAAPDPGPAVGAMARSGVLWRILPGAGATLLPVLLHVEQGAGLLPDPLRRLAALGGEAVAGALRLSRSDAARLARLTGAMEQEASPEALGYHLGWPEALDVLALRAALSGQETVPEKVGRARQAAGARLPLTAADLAPLAGPALGRALRQAERLWLDSGLTLTRAALIAAVQKGA
jgi:poly(A) polymerase